MNYLALFLASAAAVTAGAASALLTSSDVNHTEAEGRSDSNNGGKNGYEPLSPWDKILIMSVSAGVVALTVVVVLCAVMPGCPVNRWCCGEDVEGEKISYIHILVYVVHQ